MPPNVLQYSVVIVTYHRHAPLCDTLRALASYIDPTAGEILVIDQCPLGTLPADVLVTPGLRYINLDRPNMVAARNMGIQHARGEVVIFLDDDVVPLTGLISAHLAAYSDTLVGGVAGYALEKGSEPRTAPNTRVFDMSEGWRDAHFDHPVPGNVMTARGCNMSFRREVIIRLGGFDPFIQIFRDDTDMCLRVIAAGFVIRYVPAAGLIHLSIPSGGTRGNAAEAGTRVVQEWRMYRQLHRHYRDNLYFLARHFRGRALWQCFWEAYRTYVGVSRWPWRLAAKNMCFFFALWQATRMAQYRRHNPRVLADLAHEGRGFPPVGRTSWRQYLFESCTPIAAVPRGPSCAEIVRPFHRALTP